MKNINNAINFEEMVLNITHARDEKLAEFRLREKQKTEKAQKLVMLCLQSLMIAVQSAHNMEELKDVHLSIIHNIMENEFSLYIFPFGNQFEGSPVSDLANNIQTLVEESCQEGFCLLKEAKKYFISLENLEIEWQDYGPTLEIRLKE